MIDPYLLEWIVRTFDGVAVALIFLIPVVGIFDAGSDGGSPRSDEGVE